MRPFWTLAHRYAGLALVVFLVIAGLTGSLITFYHELDTSLNPGLFEASPPSADAKPLDGFALRERLQAEIPHAWVHTAPLHMESDKAVVLRAQAAQGSDTGEAAALEDDEYFFDPYSGDLLGARKWGDIGQGSKNLMPFLYKFHYSLAIPGNWGFWLFGIAALIWTLDCFVGFYLTLPGMRAKARASSVGQDCVLPASGTLALHRRKKPGFWSRWKPAWQIKWRSNRWRINFDLHRAFGLWLWAMLFVFAWSSVGLNLGSQVYQPLMGAMFDMNNPFVEAPKLEQAQAQPGILWREAHPIARQLMSEQAWLHDFEVIREDLLGYIPGKALYYYRVKSDRDTYDARYAHTSLYFDANTGAFKGLKLPTGQASGETITSWLYALHFGSVKGLGLPYRIFVCIMGLVIAILSITGVLIWWKKRKGRRARASRIAPPRIAGSRQAADHTASLS